MLSAKSLYVGSVTNLLSSGGIPLLYLPDKIPMANGDQHVDPYLNLSKIGPYSFSNLSLTSML